MTSFVNKKCFWKFEQKHVFKVCFHATILFSLSWFKMELSDKPERVFPDSNPEFWMNRYLSWLFSDLNPFSSRRVLRIYTNETDANREKLYTMDNLGIVLGDLIGCNLAAWVLIFFCPLKGVQSSVKVVFFTATFLGWIPCFCLQFWPQGMKLES